MQPSLATTVFTVFAASSLVIAVLLGLALLRTKRPSGLWLLLMVAIGALNVLQNTLYAFHLAAQWPWLIRVVSPLNLLLGPCIYFYISQLTQAHDRFRPFHFLHFAPAGVAALLVAVFHGQDAELRVQSIYQTSFNNPLLFDVVLTTVHAFIYILLAFRKLHLYENWLKLNFSDIEKRKLGWLNSFLWLWVLALITVIAMRILLLPFIQALPLPIGAFVILFGVAYLGLIHSEIFVWDQYDEQISLGQILPQESSANGPTSPGSPRYLRSRMKDDEIKRLSELLVKTLETEKPHLNNDLKIGDLARLMGISSHQLSQVMNIGRQQSFYDLINDWRVQEAKRLLDDTGKSHLTLLAISEEAGFNSKSVFNAAFKAKTGMTPSAYRDRKVAPSDANPLN